MARLFDDALSEYLEIDQAVLSGMPLAMMCFFNVDVSLNQTLIFIEDKDVDDQYRGIYLAGGETRKVVISAKSGASGQEVVANTQFSLNAWHYACGIFVASNDRRMFFDSDAKVTANVDVGATNLDRLSIGRIGRATPGLYISGMIAEAAIYDLSQWPGVTDSDKADNFEKILPSLAKGFSPLFYPLGLKAYWPLIRGLNDKVGAYNLTPSGTIVVPHPRVILPQGARY